MIITAGPKASNFINLNDEKRVYFFDQNPWKVCDYNNFQKVYRYCICCGTKRFDDKEWEGTPDSEGPPTICNKVSCFDYLSDAIDFIPKKFFTVQTWEKNDVALDKTKEQYNIVFTNTYPRKSRL